jgi:hypothetical protein
VSGVDEAVGLAVDSRRQSAMKEGILDVEMMDRAVLGEGEGEDGVNGGKLDDEAECFVVVYSRAQNQPVNGPCSGRRSHLKSTCGERTTCR